MIPSGRRTIFGSDHAELGDRLLLLALSALARPHADFAGPFGASQANAARVFVLKLPSVAVKLPLALHLEAARALLLVAVVAYASRCSVWSLPSWAPRIRGLTKACAATDCRLAAPLVICAPWRRAGSAGFSAGFNASFRPSSLPPARSRACRCSASMPSRPCLDSFR